MLASFPILDGNGPISWLSEFSCWLLIWSPAVAILEYTTHRWIMHKANPVLDPELCQLKAHGKHHQGDNSRDLVDVPLRNPLRLTAPLFLIVLAWGVLVSGASSVVLPAAALFAWTCPSP